MRCDSTGRQWRMGPSWQFPSFGKRNSLWQSKSVNQNHSIYNLYSIYNQSKIVVLLYNPWAYACRWSQGTRRRVAMLQSSKASATWFQIIAPLQKKALNFQKFWTNICKTEILKYIEIVNDIVYIMRTQLVGFSWIQIGRSTAQFELEPGVFSFVSWKW